MSLLQENGICGEKKLTPVADFNNRFNGT